MSTKSAFIATTQPAETVCSLNTLGSHWTLTKKKLLPNLQTKPVVVVLEHERDLWAQEALHAIQAELATYYPPSTPPVFEVVTTNGNRHALQNALRDHPLLSSYAAGKAATIISLGNWASQEVLRLRVARDL